MGKFSHRSLKKELLDGDNIPFKEIAQNLKELDFINHHLGGHAISLSGLKKVIGKRNEVTICEIGCGGGDNLRVLDQFCKKNRLVADFIGIDINYECIKYAKVSTREIEACFITSDYKQVVFKKKPDIIFSSLFCHHFSEADLVEMLRWMQENSTAGFFINDLQRHPLAYYSIRFLVTLFSKSPLVKNDAPLSVLRAFNKEEWETLFKKAGIKRFQINWKWAFRYLIICQKENSYE